MNNDVYLCTPINGTAARVVGQGGCSNELTLRQRKESLVDRINQIVKEVVLLPKKSKERKALGIETQKINKNINEINVKIKHLQIGFDGRGDLTNCVYRVMREQLTPFQYKQIMRLARELYGDDLKERENNQAIKQTQIK